MAEVKNVTFVFIDTIDSDESKTFEDIFTFKTFWTLTVITAMKIDAGSLIATQWSRSHCTFVDISTTLFKVTVVAFASETFLTCTFKTTISVGTGGINVAVVCSISAFVDVSTNGIIIAG